MAQEASRVIPVVLVSRHLGFPFVQLSGHFGFIFLPVIWLARHSGHSSPFMPTDYRTLPIH